MVTGDPCLPTHHVRPPRGWLNDPNGLCWSKGRWHVFFQYNPDSHVHHRIRWGHASSVDLLHWQVEPDALVPARGQLNVEGSWSGCLTFDDGLPTACFTALGTTPAEAVAAVARGSDDLRTWRLVPRAAAPRTGEPDEETRDPFVVVIGGRRYVIQGHGGPRGGARLLVYDATDLENWQPLGVLLDDSDPVAAQVAPADIWECPNLVQVDGQWVLLVSLWRHDGTQGQLCGVRWLVGELDTGGPCPRFLPRAGGVLDDGPALYAPQVITHGGRTLVFGWSWELGQDDEQVAARGWAGVISSPRELRVRGGRLCQELPREFLEAEGQPLEGSWRAADDHCVVLEAGEDCLLECLGAQGEHRFALRAGDRVVVDGSLVEVFSGERCRTTRCYPSPDSRWIASGGVAAVALC